MVQIFDVSGRLVTVADKADLDCFLVLHIADLLLESVFGWLALLLGRERKWASAATGVTGFFLRNVWLRLCLYALISLVIDPVRMCLVLNDWLDFHFDV